MPFTVPPEGVSISIQGRMLVCNGFPVRMLSDTGDRLTYTVLDGYSLDTYIRQSDGSVRRIVIDLDTVGVEDEAVYAELDPTAQRVIIPPLNLVA